MGEDALAGGWRGWDENVVRPWEGCLEESKSRNRDEIQNVFFVSSRCRVEREKREQGSRQNRLRVLAV